MIHTATIKIKVVIGEPSPPTPPPPPPFVGSRLRLRIDEDGQTVTINGIDLAEGCATATVDWADGITEQITGIVSHTYEKAGEYEVKISDDISALRFNVSNLVSNAPTSFVSNATRLNKLNQFCFLDCDKLTVVDVAESELKYIDRAVFKNCTSLRGEFFFPKVNMLGGRGITLPFCDTTGITKIHFAKANEEAIAATVPYKEDATLGTGTGVCVFDL